MRTKSSEYQIGDVKISRDVLELIATQAAVKVEGVSGLGTTPGSRVARLLPRDRGVEIEILEDKLDVNIHLTVAFGYVFREVARQVQLGVKEALEGMTGQHVRDVNVFVDGVDFAGPSRGSQ